MLEFPSEAWQVSGFLGRRWRAGDMKPNHGPVYNIR